MPRACLKCGNLQSALFYIPANPVIACQWLNALGIPEDKASNCSRPRICSKHFNEADIVYKNEKFILLKDACPTLNPLPKMAPKSIQYLIKEPIPSTSAKPPYMQPSSSHAASAITSNYNQNIQHSYPFSENLEPVIQPIHRKRKMPLEADEKIETKIVDIEFEQDQSCSQERELDIDLSFEVLSEKSDNPESEEEWKYPSDSPDSEFSDDDIGNEFELFEKKPKFVLVEFDKLVELIKVCAKCGYDRNLQTSMRGSCPTFKGKCVCGKFVWHGQSTCPSTRKEKKYIYSGNLAITAASYIAPIAFPNMSSFCKLLGMPFISEKLYYKYLKKFIRPKIDKHHETQMIIVADKVINRSQELNDQIHLSGDAQYDSPGYSAGIGHYSFIDIRTRLVVHGEVVTKSEAGNNSCKIEPIAFEKGLEKMKDRFEIASMTTDQNDAIIKIMREKFPKIKHWYDWYHVKKNFRSKLYKISKKKACKELKQLIPHIIDFLSKSIKLGDDNGELIRQYAQSMLYHLTGRHKWRKSQKFPYVTQCPHPLRRDGDAKIALNSPSYEALKEALEDEKFVETLHHIKYGHTTSDLENYNSLFIRYTPKLKYFGKKGYTARKQLADLHYNEMRMEGDRFLKNKKVYSRAARKYVTKKINRPASNQWKSWIMESVLTDSIPMKDDKFIEESDEE